MKRGEIWWAAMDSPAGKRPVALLSRDEAYTARKLVIIAPVTTRIRNIPAEVSLTPADGMIQDCVINLDTITTIDKARLLSRITSLDIQKIMEMERAIQFALGLFT